MRRIVYGFLRCAVWRVFSFLFPFLFLFCSGIAHAADAPDPAGRIDLVTGELQILQTGKAPRAGHAGDAIYEGDTLATGKNSEAHITMADTGFIALRAESRMQIVRFQADGDDKDTGVFKLFTGAMRSVTGWIGKFNRRSYLLRTPTATIGIRGTDHETRYVPPGSSDGESGTYDKVFTGETTIDSDVGQATVDPEQAGFAASEGEAQPKVLPSVPAFFRPGPHEDLINRKHAEIQKMIVERREERRRIVEQKRAELDAARHDMQAQSATNRAAAEARTAALAAQRQNTEQQAAALQARFDELARRAAAIQEKRRALQEGFMTGSKRGNPLRGEFRVVWATGRTFGPEYQAIREARAAIAARSTVANDARNAAAQAQRKESDARLAALNETTQGLQQRQQALQAAREALEKQAAKLKPADLAQQRGDLRKQGEALAADQKQNQNAFDALFYDNTGKAEARLLEARQQLQQSEDERAALNDREAAARERQHINEEKLEALETRAVDNVNGDQAMRDRLAEVHDGIAALNADRAALQGERQALHERNVAASKARQAEAQEQIEALRAKHRGMEDKRTDLQNEVKAMETEIRGLFEAEQKRYSEELRTDRESANKD